MGDFPLGQDMIQGYQERGLPSNPLVKWCVSFPHAI